jgi:hypothetical protein
MGRTVETLQRTYKVMSICWNVWYFPFLTSVFFSFS